MKKGESGQSSAPMNSNGTVLNKQYDSQLNISDDNNPNSSNYQNYENDDATTTTTTIKPRPKAEGTKKSTKKVEDVIYSKKLNDGKIDNAKCDCLAPLRRMLNSPDFLSPDCAHSHKNLHIGTQNVAIDAGPPPPPPEGREDLWDLQFCRWWGWNWVKRRDVASGPCATQSTTRQNNFKIRPQFQQNLDHRDCQCQYMTPNYQQQNLRKVGFSGDENEFPVSRPRKRICARGNCGGSGGNSFTDNFFNSLCVSNRRSYGYYPQRRINTVPSNRNGLSPSLSTDNFGMDCLAFLCGPDPYVGDHHHRRQRPYMNRNMMRRQGSFDSMMGGCCRSGAQFNTNSWLVAKNSCSSECIREPVYSRGAMAPYNYPNNNEDYFDYLNARMQQCCGGCGGGGGCCCQCCCCCCCSCDDTLPNKDMKMKCPMNCMTQTRRRGKCAVTQTKTCGDGYQSKPTTREGIISIPPKPPFRRMCHMRCCCCCCRRRRRCCCCCRCSSTCKNSTSKNTIKKQTVTLPKKSPAAHDKNAKQILKDKQKNARKKVDKSTVHFLKYLPLIDGLLVNYNKDKKFLNHSTTNRILLNKSNNQRNKFDVFNKHPSNCLIDDYKSVRSDSSGNKKTENHSNNRFLDPLQSLNCIKSMMQNSNRSDVEHKLLLSAVGDALLNTTKNNINKKQSFKKINPDVSFGLDLKLADLNDIHLYADINNQNAKENNVIVNSDNSEQEEEENSKNNCPRVHSLLSLEHLLFQKSFVDFKNLNTHLSEPLADTFSSAKIKTSSTNCNNFDFQQNDVNYINIKKEFLKMDNGTIRTNIDKHDDRPFDKIINDFTLPSESINFYLKQSKRVDDLQQSEAIDLSKTNNSRTSIPSSSNKTNNDDYSYNNRSDKCKKETVSKKYMTSPAAFTKTGLLPMLNADYFRQSMKRISTNDRPVSAKHTFSLKRPRQNSDTNCAANNHNSNLPHSYNFAHSTYKSSKGFN